MRLYVHEYICIHVYERTYVWLFMCEHAHFGAIYTQIEYE